MNVPQRPSIGVCAPGHPAAAERVYRLLLRAYPAAFRAQYGREMTLVFRDQCREGDVGTVGFWMTLMWDVARSAPALHAEAWRGRARENTRTLGAIMRIAAMLTVLLGVVGALGAVVDGVAGQRQGFGGTHLLSVVLGGLAGMLLLVAGVALWRRTPSGRQTATVAALASLVIAVVARLVFPWMSIFSQLVAIGLPIALVIALHWPGRRGPSASGLA
jgi:hypothetical protein